MEPVRYCWCPNGGCRAVADVSDFRMVHGSTSRTITVTVCCCAGHHFVGMLESDVVYME